MRSMKKYQILIKAIGQILEERRKEAIRSVNQILVRTYWEIGRQIVEYEQEGKEKAVYGSYLLDDLSRDLRLNYGSGFSRRNVLNMRRFYLLKQIWQTVSAKLSWSHYIGQMNLYLNYFKKEESSKEDNPPIGIVLGTEKDELIVEFALGGITNKLFVSKYQLYLPKKKELQKEIKKMLEK